MPHADDRQASSAAYTALRRVLWATWPSRIVPLWKIADLLDGRAARRVLDAWFDHVKECDGC